MAVRRGVHRAAGHRGYSGGPAPHSRRRDRVPAGILLARVLWGLGLGVLAPVVPPLLVFLPGRLSSSLTDPALARPATSVLLLRAGVLIEFARFGVVTLQDVQLRDAVWLGLGIQFLNVLASLTFYAVKVSLRPSPLDPEQAAAGRADPRSYGQRVFRFGRNTLVEVGLSRLLALSPWLAFVTVPVGACQARRT